MKRARSSRHCNGDRDMAKQREAGHELHRLFKTLYAVHKISAQEFCILNYWADRADVLGADFAGYGLPPGEQSGRYQQFLDSKIKERGPYEAVTVPCSSKHKAGRAETDIEIALAYESIADEIRNTPDASALLASAQLPRVYHENKHVQKAKRNGRPLPWPVALYSDGVQYTSSVGRGHVVTGITMINVVTKKRHHVGAIGSFCACSCGCKGWCTMFPILCCCAWQLQVLASGKRTLQRYNGETVSLNSNHILAQCIRKWGNELGFNAVLIYVMGDWMDAAKTHGLPAVMASYNFCPFCRCEKQTMISMSGECSLCGWPWFDVHADAYEEFCQSCEIKVSLTNENDRHELMSTGKLKYIKGNTGKGRTISADVPRWHLTAGDVVVPSKELLDIGKLETASLPLEVTFWRQAVDIGGKAIGLARRRNPIFSRDLDTSPVQNMAVDALHTFYFGPMQRVVAASLWRVLLHNHWGIRGPKSHRLEAGARLLRHHHQRWCANMNIPHSMRLNDWKLSFMGDVGTAQDSPDNAHPGCEMRLKAVEIGLVLRWVIVLLEEIDNGIPFRNELLVSCKACVRFLHLCRDASDVFTDAECQQAFDAMHTHISQAIQARVNVEGIAKVHFCTHLAQRTVLE